MWSWEEILEYQRKREAEVEDAREFDLYNALDDNFEASSLIEAFSFLPSFFEELKPREFYQKLFSALPLEKEGEMLQGYYHPVVQAVNVKASKEYKELTQHFKDKGHPKPQAEAWKRIKHKHYPFVSTTFKLYDGLEYVDTITSYPNDDNFFFLSPITYIGKRRTKDNARMLYALCIEIDNLVVREGVQTGFYSLIKQMKNDRYLPSPTLIAWSGNGLHLYYVLKTPVALFKATARSINKFRKLLIRRIWNSSVTESYKLKDIQWETIFQGFRMVGTPTKRALKEHNGEVCRGFIFKEGKTWTLEELWSYGKKADLEKLKEADQQPKHTLAMMRNEYGDKWVEEHFTKRGKWKGLPPKFWKVNEGFYRSFLQKIYDETEEGHRFNALCMLSAVGWKCGIDDERIENDMNALKDYFNSREYIEPLKDSDVFDALTYRKNQGDELNKYKNEYLTENAGVSPYPERKRNGRKLLDHINRVNQLRSFRKNELGEDEYKNNGRPTKQAKIKIYREENPEASMYQCVKDTGLSKNTVKKWWGEK